MIDSHAQDWFPVANADDLVARHVFQGELNGVELALWRDDDDCVNAWENRCRHRSVRLSLGVNTGRRLRCQYHGWQYRSGDGQCVVVPAASQTPPPASVCARTFAVAERHGLIWVNLYAPNGTAMTTPAHWLTPASSETKPQHELRSFVFHADIDSVSQALDRYPQCDPQLAGQRPAIESTAYAVSMHWPRADANERLLFLLQPARAHKTIVHTLLDTAATSDAELRTWQDRHHAAMVRLRQRLIAQGVVASMPVPGQHFIAPPAPESMAQSRARLFDARVTRRYDTAEGIVAFELEPEHADDIGALADFMPGAHIDVTTPADTVRQYSIVSLPGHSNDSSERGVPGVTLGIKREPDSRGGSVAIHDHLQAGQIVKVSRPKNHFRIANNRGALLLAGGIGVTPLLSMASHMQTAGRDYALHYFVRSAQHVAFRDRIERLQQHQLHVGLAPADTASQLTALLAAVADDTDIYVCGPRPFLDAVVTIAEQENIATDRVHFELFSNSISHADDKPFRVRLARSDEEFEVPAGQPLSDVLIGNGHALETSCEQGVCGTCMVPVLAGEIEHRDVYLSDDEKRAGRCMQACVSRARSELLVLDL